MRRSVVLLLGAVAAAGGLTLLDSNEAPPPVRIDGAALAETAIQTTTAAVMAPAVPGDLTKMQPAGGAAVDAVDPDGIIRDGDRYFAQLPTGKLAELTLDPQLQELAESLLNQSRVPRGAIVAMAPDGRILALAGRRTESTTGGKDGISDPRLATSVWAPSASVFKLVTAAALVHAGVDPEASVCYHGGIRSVMESNLADSKKDNRCESLAFGVGHSQNAILGKLAYQKLVPQTLEAEAKALGWSAPTVLGLPSLDGIAGELALPGQHDLEFAKAAAGFHGAKLSVLGGALLAATFANAGQQPAPRLVAKIDGQPVPVAPGRRMIDASAAEAVARMMVGTCADGSASRSFRGGKGRYQVAGKTGTLTTDSPFYIEHSWFVGFAPADKPQIIVSVLLGNPEDWWLRGHEAARKMIDRALGPQTAMSRDKDRQGALALATP